MKNIKHKNRDRREYDDEEDYRPAKKKDSPRRRPIRNWTRAWEEHQTEVDEIDDFYGK